MKKKYVMLLLALLLALSACGKQPETSAAAENQASEIDVDLTALSSTMVYSEVYNMLTAPESYVGKTVKMTGGYSSFMNEDTGAVYRVCMIADASACCAQGMEFVLKDGMAYPEMESDITVVGTFQVYDENGATFCHLVNAELV